MSFSQFKRAYEANFLRNDLLVVSIVTLILAGLISIWPGAMNSVPNSTRSQMYATGAAISATLTGFTLVSITLMMDITTLPPMKILRQSRHYPKLYETFLSATKILGLATLVFLGVLLADRGAELIVWLFLPVAWIGLMSMARMMRCLWIISAVIGIIAKPDIDF